MFHIQTIHVNMTQSNHDKNNTCSIHEYLLYASGSSTLGTVKEFFHTLLCQLASLIKHCQGSLSNQPQSSVQEIQIVVLAHNFITLIMMKQYIIYQSSSPHSPKIIDFLQIFQQPDFFTMQVYNKSCIRVVGNVQSLSKFFILFTSTHQLQFDILLLDHHIIALGYFLLIVFFL